MNAIDRDLEELEAFVLGLRRAGSALHEKLRVGDALDATINKATALWLMRLIDGKVIERLATERTRTGDEASDRALMQALDTLQAVFVPQLLYLQRAREAAFDQGRGQSMKETKE